MNVDSVRGRLSSILKTGLPVVCKFRGITVTGSYTSAQEEVLLLEYGSIEDYRRSVIFAGDAFVTAPKKDEVMEVAGVRLHVLGCREEPGISITVDLRK